MSHRRNWDVPVTSPRKRACPSRGWGSPNSDDWRKSLALLVCLCKSSPVGPHQVDSHPIADWCQLTGVLAHTDRLFMTFSKKIM